MACRIPEMTGRTGELEVGKLENEEASPENGSQIRTMTPPDPASPTDPTRPKRPAANPPDQPTAQPSNQAYNKPEPPSARSFL